MSEQFALKQVFRNCRTVNRQERAMGTIAVLVDRSSNDLLTCSTLTQDQDRHVLCCHSPDLPVHFLHGRTLADQQVAILLR